MNNTARTILKQLGGGRFVAMTGAKNMIDLGNGLATKIGRNSSGINHLQVELDASDTYTVRFSRVANRGLKVTDKGTFEGIYADQLVPLFEKETGLYTSL